MDSAPLSEQAIIAALTHMIAHELDVRIPEQDIDPTIALIESGLMLDSMVLFELIALIEERYHVKFPSDDLRTEHFANLTVLAKHILVLREQEPRA